jgi:asparagine synthetase B (glutamine-hydrolysing)
MTVALTGDGGDELFAGYPTMAAEWWQGAFGRLPASVLGLLRRGAGALPQAAAPFRGDGREHRKPLWSLLAFELWRTEYLGDSALAW